MEFSHEKLTVTDSLIYAYVPLFILCSFVCYFLVLGQLSAILFISLSPAVGLLIMAAALKIYWGLKMVIKHINQISTSSVCFTGHSSLSLAITFVLTKLLRLASSLLHW
jgi:hypothetical protein